MNEPFVAVYLIPLSLVIGEKAYVAVVAASGVMAPLKGGKFALKPRAVEPLYKIVISKDDLDEARFLTEIEPVIALVQQPPAHYESCSCHAQFRFEIPLAGVGLAWSYGIL